MKEKVVLCSGSYSGPRDLIMGFERALLDDVDASQCHKKGVPSDQGYLNKLFFSGELMGAVVQERGVGLVNTVGSMDGSRPRSLGHLPKSHINLKQYWKIIDEDGYVIQNDGTRSIIVHQW